MVPYDRFTVVLDACALFPMLPRDVLLTLASHEFFSPKWSARIRQEWTRNLLARMRARSSDVGANKRVEHIAAAMEAAFPDAQVDADIPEPQILEPVSPKDRHVVVTAIVTRADAIITFNVADFAVQHLKEHLRIEVIHPDDFVIGRSQREACRRSLSRAARSKEESSLDKGRVATAAAERRSGPDGAMVEFSGCGRVDLDFVEHNRPYVAVTQTGRLTPRP